MENRSQLPDTLLIVDDSELNRIILKEIFRDTYKIEEAADGKKGWDLFLEHQSRICAILLDMIMPEMDGMTFLRRMKKERKLKKIPVFLITAMDNQEMLKEAYELGVIDIISKPVVPYMIRRRVDSVIELFRARKKLKEKIRKQSSEISIKNQRIAELNKGLIETLATAIEFRSGESGEHVRRIMAITKLILSCTEMGEGLSGQEIEQISLAAILHDVGKIAVSDQILNKPGKLTPQEYEAMKLHTVKGAEMLSHIPKMEAHDLYRYAYDIARYHHERWDGRGYPDGLKGNAIPLSAQIVSIADVYDALVSKRVYKDAIAYDKAMEMIENGECGMFNPRLLTSFTAIEKECRKLYQTG